MKKLYTLIFFLCIAHFTYAQFPGGGWGKKKGPSIKGKITGKIYDALNNEAVAYATISLRKPGSEKIINGALTDDNGSFKFTDVGDGKYELEVSFLGYKTMLVKDVELTLKDPDYNVGNVLLEQDNVVLDEVEIKDKRSLVENKVDKIVFNAEDDTSISGGDATDVLRKVPMLSVDLDGNVSLRGSQQIRILINGKPSGMFSANSADALKMFPADQIKKVEVISSPGAKYDGEGSGGIINIITKKENVEGVAGTINASLGNRQNNGNLNLNIGKGRFGFSSNGGFFYSVPIDAANSFSRRLIPSETVTFSRTGTTNTSRLGFRGSASAFYDFNAYNALNTSINIRGFGFDTESEGTWFRLMEDLDTRSDFSTIGSGKTLNSGYDWNTDYTKKFAGNDKQELVFAVQVSGGAQSSDNFATDNNVNEGYLLRDERIFNDPDNIELTGQIDYVHPVGKSNKLEIGVKSVIRNIDSSSEFYFNSGPDTYDILDQERSNRFLYDQDVYAGYASYNFYLGKFNAIVGGRLENTVINGDGTIAEQNFPEERYTNFLPNIAISRTLSNFRTIKLGYSQRIQRPSLRNINPFENTTDLGNTVVGNPTLGPELTKQIELGYNTNVLGISLFGTAYYRITTDIIESFARPDGLDRSRTEFLNNGKNNSLGLNLFATKSVGKLTMRGGGDVFQYNAEGLNTFGEKIENDAISYRIFTSAEYSFSSSIKADFFGIFNAPRFTLQGQNPGFSMIAFGMRKEFKNSSIGIRIVEPWSEFKNFDSEINGDGFYQESRFAIPFRSFGLTYRYKFGKVEFRERRSRIKNDDVKAGEDGGMQGGNNGNSNSRG